MAWCLVKQRDNFTFTFTQSNEVLENCTVGELHYLYSSQDVTRVIKSWKMRLVRHVTRMEGMRYSYKILVGKPEGKRQRGDEVGDDTETNFKEMRYEDLDWIQLTQDRDQWRALVKKIINFRVS
jgi:hypothetical protein